MTTTVATKQEQVRYRVEPRNLNGIVIYKIASSDEQSEYEVTLVNGKVSSCTCPAHRRSGVVCWVQRTALEKEADYQAHRLVEERAAMDAFAAEIVADALAQAAPVAAPARLNRAALNNRELRFENGIPMR